MTGPLRPDLEAELQGAIALGHAFDKISDHFGRVSSLAKLRKELEESVAMERAKAIRKHLGDTGFTLSHSQAAISLSLASEIEIDRIELLTIRRQIVEAVKALDLALKECPLEVVK